MYGGHPWAAGFRFVTNNQAQGLVHLEDAFRMDLACAALVDTTQIPFLAGARDRASVRALIRKYRGNAR